MTSIRRVSTDVVEVIARGPQGPGGSLALYGSFYDLTDQPLISTSANQAVQIGSTAESRGIRIDNGTKIVLEEAGTYSMTFSVQITNSNNNIQTATVWVRHNGVTYENSASHVDVPGARGGVKGATIVTVNFVATGAAEDVVEIMWAGTNTGLTLKTYDNGAPGAPKSPAIILTMVQVMFSQTAPVQFIADTTEPETPSGGGVIFVQDGALKYKGSAGTVTTIADA
jgi:hypothetical protein